MYGTKIIATIMLGNKMIPTNMSNGICLILCNRAVSCYLCVYEA
jgi:hypothetical protein